MGNCCLYEQIVRGVGGRRGGTLQMTRWCVPLELFTECYAPVSISYIVKPSSQYDAEPRVASRYEFVNGQTRTLLDATRG